MNTQLIYLNPEQMNETELQKAVKILQEDQCIAIPTETVYGLAANALSELAIKRIFEAKGRPSDNPLIVHVSNMSMLKRCIHQDLSSRIMAIIDAFWPGPLTLVFKKSKLIPNEVSAHLETVGIRWPNHPIALALIETSGFPLAAPSANVSGRPSPTKAEHVLHDLSGKIAGIIMAEQSAVGVESTVLDVSGDDFRILRKGGVSLESLQHIDPAITYDDALAHPELTPKSPGQKYKHYAPSKPMLALSGNIESLVHHLQTMDLSQILLISTDEIINHLDVPYHLSLGSYHDHDLAMNRLFDCLRVSETLPVESIIITGFEDSGLGATLNDRISKASSQKLTII